MNSSKYKLILYAITTTIIATIAVQIYWNSKNYQLNKQRLTNEIQISLDNAVERYYADITKNSMVAFVDVSTDTINSKNRITEFFKNIKVEDMVKHVSIADSSTHQHWMRTTQPETIDEIKIFKGIQADSVSKIEAITNRIVISLSQDTIHFNKLNKAMQGELERKSINLTYGFHHYQDTIKKSFYNTDLEASNQKMLSKSTYLKPNEKLELVYQNNTLAILKRSSSGILISALLSLAIISCLFYLLKIIKHQKQLAEVKNDLISNITHEFKTPIATIGAAIESIKNFKVLDDKEKTKNYLSISNNQLGKLTVMVEKLLETATLDSDSLQLNKEEVHINSLLETLVNRHQLQDNNKTITYHNLEKDIIILADAFHLENAINNIIDNAIKYGGNSIDVNLNKEPKGVSITVSDDGNKLTNGHKEKIFEKFYRIPKGNTHDVKGFGIGLYYSKKIIEKHNGSITLQLDNKLTTFKIIVPNE